MQYLGKKIAILGFGQEGQDVFNWLKRFSQNCQINIYDPFHDQDLSGYDFIFRSPGIWRLHSRLLAAEKSGALITSATKVFFQHCPCPIIGVTGTKGKGTTATLIAKILNQAKKKTYLAGNIGKPMLKLLPKLKPNNFVCLELSSFQLQDLDSSPHIAVVLNINRDHLDVHRSLSEYRRAKSNIVRHQTKKDFAVINADYPVSSSFSRLTSAQIRWFSRKKIEFDPKKLKLRGQHNWENVAAAMASASCLGIEKRLVLKSVYQFKGLEHRLELVRVCNGVSYYNDSFSTTPETAIAAIKSFSEPIILILGGSDKGSDYRQLGQEISRCSNLKALILIGKMAKKIQQSIPYFSGPIITGLNSMELIVNQASAIASNKDVVLLSPACASFDMFKNYKDRGNQFKNYVKNLK